MSLTLEVIWEDDGLIKIRARAENGRFAGTADCYIGHDTLVKMAEELRGFPKCMGDQRQFMLGTFSPCRAEGGCRLRLRCLNHAGYSIGEISFRDDNEYTRNRWRPSVAEFSIEVWAAAIDDFIRTLTRMPIAKGEIARLG